MQSFCSQSALTPAYHVCWGIQPLVPPLGNLLTLKSITFRTSFSVFHCLPALSISLAGEAITKTIPCDRQKLIKLMLRKYTFLPPHSHLIGQFVKWHLVTIWREQHVLAQWLRHYFCQDHGMCSVLQVVFHPTNMNTAWCHHWLSPGWRSSPSQATHQIDTLLGLSVSSWLCYSLGWLPCAFRLVIFRCNKPKLGLQPEQISILLSPMVNQSAYSPQSQATVNPWGSRTAYICFKP